MSILVAVASRHGSTADIAEAIGQELRSRGHRVDVRTVDDSPMVESHEAVIIGSAVYMDNWLAQARQFVEHNQLELTRVPVWLFSSGPLEADDPEAAEPVHLGELMQHTRARGHRVFVGKLDKTRLGLIEKVILWNVNHLNPGAVVESDHRDWEAIRAWADEIATVLADVAGDESSNQPTTSGQ
jgi:menaquinone-dependent protoporphyrinogen oxidase